MRFLPVCALLLVGCSQAVVGGSTSESSVTEAAPTIHVRTARDRFAADATSIIYSDETHIRVEGVAAGTEVTLGTRTYSPVAFNKGYLAEGVFVADANGVVDTSVTPSLRGSYTGVEAEGLTWAGALSDVPEDPSADRAGMAITAKVGGAVVASFSVARTITSPDVHWEKVTSDGLVAELYLPAGSEGQIPIIAFGGSEGGIRTGEATAARVASWGHPVLAIAYFGLPGVPADLSEVPLEYFQKAFAYLDSRPELAHGKTIVTGGSRGGELALLLGATFPRVVAVVADAPSAYLWSSLDGSKSAWTYEGQPLPYVPGTTAGVTTTTTPDGKTALVVRPNFELALRIAPAAAREAARIPVERINGPVLMFGGSGDQLWESCDFMAEAKAKLDATGHAQKYGDDTACFPDAGHLMSLVGQSTESSMWAQLDPQTLLALGGSARGNAHAGRLRDEKLHAFLDRVTH